MTKYCGKDLLVQRGFEIGAAWAMSTAYAVGDVVSNGGNAYICTTAGTSAASGGPTTTVKTEITDGTAGWKYLSAVDDGYGYKSVAGLRSTSSKVNNEQVDVTDKDDEQWRQLIACGIRSMECSGSGVFTDDVSHDYVQNDAIQGSIVQYRIVSGRGDKFVGPFLIAGCERNGEYNGAEQYSITLASASAITYTPAT